MTAVESVQPQQATGYQLVATDEAELTAAHAKMIEWARGKQLECDAEKAEESENLRVASEHKWATAAFRKRIALLERRRVFYEKIEIALNAGYVIVPNFEMTVFAIRTTANGPRGGEVVRSWGSPNFEQTAQLLPAGEGEYKNPQPLVMERKELREKGDGKTEQVTRSWPDEFRDIDFPLALAKPVLMSRTAQAMASKVFDEIGVAVDTRTRGSRRGDPIILGRIRNPRNGRPDMTFFVGWYFDPTNI